MENQVDIAFFQVHAVMAELREKARRGSGRSKVINDTITDQLEILSKIRSSSTASDREKIKIMLLALETRRMIGVPTEGLTREILWGGTASVKQQVQAVNLRFRLRRRTTNQ